MKKKKIFDRIVLVLAIISFLIAMIEGYFYYEQYKGYRILHWLLMLQNGVSAFSFHAKISTIDMLKSLQEGRTYLRAVVGYSYAVAISVAPLCTAAAFYRVVETVLRWNVRFHRKRDIQQILICGYNENVKSLIRNQGKIKRRIHLLTASVVSEVEKQKLTESGIILHEMDFINASEKKREEFFKAVDGKYLEYIILFEKSSAANFSLYCAFSQMGFRCDKNVKFYCNCEDEGIHRIIEDYYDVSCDEGKIPDFDLETFSVSELQVRELFKDAPLEQYYEESNCGPDDWHIHLLILGFGKLGKQILFQAMNQGVFSSSNKILIDVVDKNADEKRDHFENYFSSTYLKSVKESLCIPAENADGNIEIRFHKVDVRGKTFHNEIKEWSKEIPFTYVAICMKDTNLGVHALGEVESFLMNTDNSKNVTIAMRMELDAQMARYLNSNKKTHNKVVIIGDEGKLYLDQILDSKIDGLSKCYNYLYSQIKIEIEAVSKESKNLMVIKQEELEEIDSQAIEKSWRELNFYKRASNRALCYHAVVKDKVVAYYMKQGYSLESYFGKDGIFHKKAEHCWVFYGTEDELVSTINKDVFLKEMAMLEHRRWCYYMAAKGWRNTNEGKSDELRKNPCMKNWEQLCKGDTMEKCKYDLLPLMVMYENAGKMKS